MSNAVEQLSQELSIAATPIYPQIVNGPSNPVYTTGVNMARFERVMFVGVFGVLTSGASILMKLQYSADNLNFYDLGGAAANLVNGSSGVVSIECRAGQLGLGNTYVRCALIEQNGVNAYASVVPLGGAAHQEPASALDITAVVQRLVL